MVGVRRKYKNDSLDVRHWFYKDRYRRKKKSALAFESGEWRKWKRQVTVKGVNRSLERLFKGD